MRKSAATVSKGWQGGKLSTSGSRQTRPSPSRLSFFSLSFRSGTLEHRVNGNFVDRQSAKPASFTLRQSPSLALPLFRNHPKTVRRASFCLFLSSTLKELHNPSVSSPLLSLSEQKYGKASVLLCPTAYHQVRLHPRPSLPSVRGLVDSTVSETACADDETGLQSVQAVNLTIVPCLIIFSHFIP